MRHARSVLKSIIFLFLLFIMIIVLSWVFSPYWRYSDDPDDAGESPRYQDFYAQPANSIDYIVLGSSSTYHSLDPMRVYNETGYTGFNLGSPSQPMSCSWFWLQEALKTQTPKCVFVDTGSFISDLPDDGMYLKCLMPMAFSPLKIQAAFECSHDRDLLYTVLFPLYQFHDRWKELSSADVKKGFKDEYLTKGGTIRFVSREVIKAPSINLREEKTISVDSNGNAVAVLNPVSLNKESLYYYSKISGLCVEKGIRCIPVKFPTKNWNDRWSREIRKETDKGDSVMWDMSLADNPAGINWEKDSFDNGKHLNYYGMVKVSDLVSEYLKHTGEFTDHRNDPAYASWNDDVAPYISWEKDKITSLLRSDEGLRDFMVSLEANRDDYVFLLSGQGDLSKGQEEWLIEAFEEIGFRADFADHPQESLIAVCEDIGDTLQVWDPDVINYEFVQNCGNGKKLKIEMKSSGISSDCEIMSDEWEYECSGGLNLVAVDRSTGDMAAACTILTDEDGIDADIDDRRDQDTLRPLLEKGDYIISDGDISLDVCIEQDGGKSYIIKEAESGKVLTPECRGNRTGDGVVTDDDRGTADYRWLLSLSTDGGYYIRSLYNGMYLDIDGSDTREKSGLSALCISDSPVSWKIEKDTRGK